VVTGQTVELEHFGMKKPLLTHPIISLDVDIDECSLVTRGILIATGEESKDTQRESQANPQGCHDDPQSADIHPGARAWYGR
jgi:hypothetical protein